MKKVILKYGWIAPMMILVALFSFKQDNNTTTTHTEVKMDEELSFEDGEELVYKVSYNLSPMWVSAGEVVFKVTDKGTYWKFVASGRTYSSYEWFYRVRDHHESHANKESLLPLRSYQNLKEGGYRLYEKVTYDRPNMKGKVARGKTPETAEVKYYDILPEVYDMLSSIYYARNIDYTDFKKGDEFPLQFFLNKDNYDTKVKFLGREVKKIKGLGKFNTIKFSPELVEGEVFTEKDAMKIWATDDKNKIPLMIETPLSVGSVKVFLKSYNGIKYDMDAEID